MDQNPKNLKNAVALAYGAGSKAPVVVASGKGVIAEQIIQLAKENGVYVHESKELVALLMDIDLDQEIPANLYLVVAELLAWLYQIEAAIPPNLKTNNK
jgi:flagellar biosynthesis protein